MGFNRAAIGCCVLVAVALAAPSAAGDLTAGYYSSKNCGGVEPIVRQEVEAAIATNRDSGVGAALIRLFFHDCWVNGCDGSVLLDRSNYNPSPEKVAGGNIGLRGFDVIDAIKGRLESVYPGVVSCADILAFAARDATRRLSNGGIDYAVPAGRKDGVVSAAARADATLPGSTASFADLKKNFSAKGFDVEDLVVLSGAHAVGVAHYPSFQDRLAAPTTEIDYRYRNALNYAVKTQRRAVVHNNVRDEDAGFRAAAGYNGSTVAGGDYLDNSYYHNNLANKVLFKSDWVLRTDTNASSLLVEYKNKPGEWNADFAAAMVKLSKLPGEGRYFEIRKKCSATNKLSY